MKRTGNMSSEPLRSAGISPGYITAVHERKLNLVRLPISPYSHINFLPIILPDSLSNHKTSKSPLRLSTIYSGSSILFSMHQYRQMLCFIQIVCIPNEFAGTISLSILSPIITESHALQPLLFKAISNILLSGFATPSSAEATIKSIYCNKP